MQECAWLWESMTEHSSELITRLESPGHVSSPDAGGAALSPGNAGPAGLTSAQGRGVPRVALAAPSKAVSGLTLLHWARVSASLNCSWVLESGGSSLRKEGTRSHGMSRGPSSPPKLAGKESRGERPAIARSCFPPEKSWEG